jgi:hypothetical protein
MGNISRRQFLIGGAVAAGSLVMPCSGSRGTQWDALAGQ